MILFISWSDTLADYRLGDWGSWASILGLAFTVFVSWKLIQIVRAIGKDRLSIERIQNPIEIYFHIRQTVQFLERLRSRGGLTPRDDRDLSRVLRGLQKSENHLEHYSISSATSASPEKTPSCARAGTSGPGGMPDGRRSTTKERSSSTGCSGG
jgi:hypothetical protein